MPFVSFVVESYTVLTTEQMGSATGSWRNLVLTSIAAAHRIRTHATIFFFDSQSPSSGVVTNVDQPNFDGQWAFAYCRKPDFPDWYDLLRNERPLTCFYGYDGPDFDPNTPTRNLYWIQLTTGQQEPPGEGPEGSQALKFPQPVFEVIKEQKRHAGQPD